ncbi:MAG: sigma-70 family RNA polymerase sigma factor [Lachnospiraceae bacterium]|nr:sigma-70 family RNA polymerase sigma factor [Lachnospiraceae bacterium]
MIQSLCTKEEIIRRNSDMVYKCAFSMLKNQMDAEDIHQEVFLKYIKKEITFECKEHEKAWFLRVTVNSCKNHWKRAWNRRVSSFSTEQEPSYEMSNPQENELLELVGRLPRKYRMVIHLFYYEELSIEEISKITGGKPSTVRTWLTRARGKLKEMAVDL